MGEKRGLELLRSIIDELDPNVECSDLHSLFGDGEGGCLGRVCSICQGEALRVALRQADEEMKGLKAKLMPEGMEWLLEVWPRFEDDSPVHFGDTALIDGEADMVEAVQLWIHGKPVIYGDGGSQQLDKGERVNRPAPKVLDADGAEILVGDTVYHVKDGSEMTVYGIEGEWLVVSVGGRVRHDIVTHRAPVIAADGRPLEVGQTVWHVGNGIESTVIGLSRPGDYQAVKLRLDDGAVTVLDPDQLTHQRPDTWERLEEDALKDGRGYFRCNRECNTCRIPDELGVSSANYGIVAACAYAQRKDLVRRAKKLAGVE